MSPFFFLRHNEGVDEPTHYSHDVFIGENGGFCEDCQVMLSKDDVEAMRAFEREEKENRVDPPRYVHNCSLCKYLGPLDHLGRRFDLYYCSQGHLRPTLIARHGSSPHECTSGMEFATQDPIMFEAFERAKRMGYLPVDAKDEDAVFEEEG